MTHLGLVYVILYILFMVTVGFSLSCCPCIFICCRKTKLRFSLNKWTISVGLLIVAWLIPQLLWFFYSPLNVCENKIVYSYPHSSLESDIWKPFWCSRPCDEARLLVPNNVSHLRAIVKHSKNVRVVGGGHSSTELQCNSDVMVAIQDEFCKFYEVDEQNVATFGAGCSVEYTLKQLMDKRLQLKGFGGIAQQKLGGAISTSLHGQHTTSFASHVVALTAMVANGSLVHVHKSDEKFLAWPGSMGRLGIVLNISIQAYPLQYVNCETSIGDDTLLLSALESEDVVGFEAKRLLLSHPEYHVRRCHEVTHKEKDEKYEDKNSYISGFFVDNVALPLITLFGSTLTRMSWFASFMFGINEVASSRSGDVLTVNDYRVSVSFNPHFDEEYSVKIEKCHSFLEEVRESFPDLTLHAYMRRVDADSSWLSWAPQSSCAIRLEYYDYNRVDFVEYERYFRLKVEDIVIRNGGSGHRGKLWYRHASDLLKHNTRVHDFERYRVELDPTGKFENLYTLESVQKGQRFYDPLPIGLQVRAFVYRLFFWFAVGVSAFVSVFLCALLGRRIHILPVSTAQTVSKNASNSFTPVLLSSNSGHARPSHANSHANSHSSSRKSTHLKRRPVSQNSIQHQRKLRRMNSPRSHSAPVKSKATSTKHQKPRSTSNVKQFERGRSMERR